MNESANIYSAYRATTYGKTVANLLKKTEKQNWIEQRVRKAYQPDTTTPKA